LKNEFQGGYGKLVTKGIEFRYDEEGNLAKKIEVNGDVWEYGYYGNGMLAKVVRPDKGEVTFKYDPLGRRIEKRSPEKVVSFLWDGNNPLHEWEEDNDWEVNNEENAVVTWVFNDGFVPSAKLTKDGNYSIITDYLGTPVEAYDTVGERVWSAELDIYGRVKEFTGGAGNAGEVYFIPFRYQGQYADMETGLYYNRFRYYDPEVGQYIQQDPIGLEGNNPTLYGYVNNPHAWIDPWGLNQCKIGSRIKENSQLIKEAERMGRNQAVQREANDLIRQFIGGNRNPGIGTKSLTSCILNFPTSKSGINNCKKRIISRKNSRFPPYMV
jgi:RHS repeat-associated protein